MTLAMIGHNNPPSEMEMLQERLASHVQEQEVFDKLSARKIPQEIATDKEAGELTDYIKSVKLLEKSIDEIFKKEKAPFWDCCKAADAWKRDYLSGTAALIKAASKPILDWNRKKEEAERQRQLEIARKAREDADKLAAEAEAHAQEGIEDTANDLMDAAIQEEQKADMIQENAYHGVVGRSRGGIAQSSNHKSLTGILDSRAALDLNALRNYFSEAELNRAIKAAVRDGVREIRGARIYQEEKLSVR